MTRPQGYVFDRSVIDANIESFKASGVSLNPSSLAGSCDRAVDNGVHYRNLRDFEAEYLLSTRKQYTQSGRRITEAGTLAPISQRTRICVGCGYSTAQFAAWCGRYVTAGDIEPPQECSLVAPYPLGRGGLYGDSGAYPSYSAKACSDHGVLTVASLARGVGEDVAKMTTSRQEDIAIARRDSKAMQGAWIDDMRGKTTRVFRPATMQLVADCIENLYPVGNGMGYQIVETPSGSNGISNWYRLNGGHWTVLDGWFTWKGDLHFIKDESWDRFPATNWPGYRVTIQTDSGPKKLYEGQGACRASDLWYYQPECWAIGWPGGR